MKKFLLLPFLFFSITVGAQTPKTSSPPVNTYNKYFISIDTNVIHTPQVTATFIKEVCAANSVNYNLKTKRYEVLTKRKLDQNIISGKLQKNLTPMSEFLFGGQESLMSNSSSTQ